MDMTKLDKDTQHAWNGWVSFTHAIGISVVVVAAVAAFVIFLLV